MIGSIVSQLTTGEGAKSFDRYGVGAYYMDHANAVYPSNAGGVPFTASRAKPIRSPIFTKILRRSRKPELPMTTSSESAMIRT